MSYVSSESQGRHRKRNFPSKTFIGSVEHFTTCFMIPVFHMSCFIPIPTWLYYYSSTIEYEVRDSHAYGSSFIVQDCFNYSSCFVFPYKVEYCFFKVYEKLCWNFDGDRIESVYFFWKLPFLLYWSYLSKSMGNLSIFLYLLQFSSLET